MDKIGFIFISSLIGTLIISQIIFIRKAKQIYHKKFIHKVLSGFICFFSAILVLFAQVFFEEYIVEDLLNYNIGRTAAIRIIRIPIVAVFNISVNYIFLKAYYKKISKNVVYPEIDTIGKE